MRTPELPPIQAEQEQNKQPNSDLQRAFVWLRRWSRELVRYLEDIASRLTSVETTVAGLTVAKSQSQLFTANGTFTAPHSGYFTFDLQGASGGTGGCGADGASPGSSAGQNIVFSVHMALNDTATIVVGAAGTAGAAGVSTGGNGGNTTVTIAGQAWTARGSNGTTGAANGTGAVVAGGQTVPNATSGRDAQLLAGGSIEGANGTAGLANERGGSCGAWQGGLATTSSGGAGASSKWGRGGNGSVTSGAAGEIGQGYGAGSGGSRRVGAGTAPGQAGVQGCVLVSWVG